MRSLPGCPQRSRWRAKTWRLRPVLLRGSHARHFGPTRPVTWLALVVARSRTFLAIACGVVEGAPVGQNARAAALIARGFAEMTHFGLARGAQAETLAGLSGMGVCLRLFLPLAHAISRSARGLAKGQSAKALMADRKTVAEGAFTAPVLQQAARAAGVDMPIVDAVCALLEGSADVKRVITALLARPLKGEG